MEKRDCIPIVSCNPTYLGLDVPAWAINIAAFSFFMYLTSIFGAGGRVLGIVALVQIFCNYIYVKVILKLEENIGAVLMNNGKIPDVVYGYFNNLPSAPEIVKALKEDNEDRG